MAGGTTTVEATAGGIHTAFVYGAVISLLAIVAAFFIRKTADSSEGVPLGH
jgi:DHA2 family lincomycin resistance protein-like MFS transporter